MYVCVCVYIYIYIYTYTHTYTSYVYKQPTFTGSLLYGCDVTLFADAINITRP